MENSENFVIRFIRFTASAFRKLPSIYVFSYFPFGFEGRIWDLIVSVSDHCLSFLLCLLVEEKLQLFFHNVQFVIKKVHVPWKYTGN